MDEIQKQHERAVGDTLIAELNQKQGTQYIFTRRGDGQGDNAPDLIYIDNSSGSNIGIGIEVVTSYYDNEDALFRWKNARNHSDAPKSWAGVNFESTFIENINKALQKKCSKNYGGKCLLAIYISPCATTYNRMSELLQNIKVPQKHRFMGIYLIGRFGVSGDSNVTNAIWELTPDSD